MLGVRQRDEVLVVDQFVFYCLPVLVTSSFSLEGYVSVTDWHPMPGGGRRGGISSCQLYRAVLLDRVWFFALTVLNRVYNFIAFLINRVTTCPKQGVALQAKRTLRLDNFLFSSSAEMQ